MAGSLIKLQYVELIDGDPLWLRFTFVLGLGQNQRLKQIDLLVPPEKLEEVQALFAQEALFKAVAEADTNAAPEPEK